LGQAAAAAAAAIQLEAPGLLEILHHLQGLPVRLVGLVDRLGLQGLVVLVEWLVYLVSLVLLGQEEHQAHLQPVEGMGVVQEAESVLVLEQAEVQ